MGTCESGGLGASLSFLLDYIIGFDISRMLLLDKIGGSSLCTDMTVVFVLITIAEVGGDRHRR